MVRPVRHRLPRPARMITLVVTLLVGCGVVLAAGTAAASKPATTTAVTAARAPLTDDMRIWTPNGHRIAETVEHGDRRTTASRPDLDRISLPKTRMRAASLQGSSRSAATSDWVWLLRSDEAGPDCPLSPPALAAKRRRTLEVVGSQPRPAPRAARPECRPSVDRAPVRPRFWGGGPGDGVNRARGEAARKHSLLIPVGGAARGLRGPGDGDQPKPQQN